MNDASRHDLVAELDMLLTSAELQDTWDAERNLNGLPNVEFTADGYRIVMHFHSDGGSLPGIQQIKRSFTTAMRRKNAYPACKIRWKT